MRQINGRGTPGSHGNDQETKAPRPDPPDGKQPSLARVANQGGHALLALTNPGPGNAACTLPGWMRGIARTAGNVAQGLVVAAKSATRKLSALENQFNVPLTQDWVELQGRLPKWRSTGEGTDLVADPVDLAALTAFDDRKLVASVKNLPAPFDLAHWCFDFARTAGRKAGPYLSRLCSLESLSPNALDVLLRNLAVHDFRLLDLAVWAHHDAGFIRAIAESRLPLERKAELFKAPPLAVRNDDHEANAFVLGALLSADIAPAERQALVVAFWTPNAEWANNPDAAMLSDASGLHLRQQGADVVMVHDEWTAGPQDLWETIPHEDDDKRSAARVPRAQGHAVPTSKLAIALAGLRLPQRISETADKPGNIDLADACMLDSQQAVADVAAGYLELFAQQLDGDALDDLLERARVGSNSFLARALQSQSPAAVSSAVAKLADSKLQPQRKLEWFGSAALALNDDSRRNALLVLGVLQATAVTPADKSALLAAMCGGQVATCDAIRGRLDAGWLGQFDREWADYERELAASASQP